LKIANIFRIFRKKQTPPPILGVTNIATELGLAQRADYTKLLEGYHSWTYACATIIARNVAKVPLHLYVKRANKFEEITEHPILELFQHVNDLQTRYELWELTVVWLELTGNAYWYLAHNKLKIPGEIWPIQPDRMKVVPGRDRLLQGYLYTHMGKKIAFEPEEIIHLKYPNPRSPWYGLGTLQAAAYSYDTDFFMRKYSINLFRNQARPDAALYTDQHLLPAEIQRVRDEWNKVYGSVENVGKIAILTAGTKYQPLSEKLQDLDFVNGRRLAREEILGIFGVPASKLGLVEDVNRANAEANDITFQKEVILPRLIMIAEKLNQDLVPRFDSRLLLKFESPVPEDWERRLKERESNIKSGYSSINEERARDGLPEAPWGKVPLLPFNLMPVGSSSTQATAGKTLIISRQSPVTKDEGRRAAAWRDYYAIHFPHERLFTAKMKELFGRQREEVLQNLQRALKNVKADPALIDFILFSAQEAEELFATVADPYFREMLLSGAKKAFADLEADIEFNFKDPNVQAFLEQRKFKFSFEVNQTTQNALRKELAEGLNAGENIKQLAERVNKVFDFAEQYRSVRIARTESTTAINKGILEAYKQSGMGPQKQWLTSRGENVRDWHRTMDGQTVNIDEPFVSGQGNALMHPGDPNAPSDEIVNCQCTMLPVT